MISSGSDLPPEIKAKFDALKENEKKHGYLAKISVLRVPIYLQKCIYL